MKPINFFSHPLMQLFSFAIILVGSSNFGGPFGYFVFFASLKGYGYAITGMMGVAVTVLCILLRSKHDIRFQLTGLVLMCFSFIWFVICNANREAMRETLPFITLMLFVAVAVAVVTKAVEIHRRV